MLIDELKEITKNKKENAATEAKKFFEINKERFQTVFKNAAMNAEHYVTRKELIGRTHIDSKVVNKLIYIICQEFGVLYKVEIYGDSYFYGW